MVEFSEDEGKVTVKSSRYKAVEGIRGRCEGCAFKKGFGCLVTEEALRGLSAEEIARMPMGLPRCQPEHRKDGRSVVWKVDV